MNVELEGSMEGQGGGHGRIMKCVVDGKINCIAKPIDHREKSAYEAIRGTSLEEITPKYFGTYESCGTEYIIIEDLTAGFKSPCIADFKVGTRHYDLTATEEKIHYLVEKQKGSTTDSHGVRYIDIQTRREGALVSHFDRKQGLKESFDGMSKKLIDFITPQHMDEFRRQIRHIEQKLTENICRNPGFRVYASSVLIAYDGDDASKPLRCSLIDFAHLYVDIGEYSADSSYDDGVIKGVETMRAVTE